MRMSTGTRCGRRSLTVASTTPAGTISQIARGVGSLFTRSAIDEAPTASARANSSTAFGDVSKTTQWWPPARSRRAMLAPMRPSPIIPICIADSSAAPMARRVRFRPSMVLEDVYELAIATGDLGDGVFPRALLSPPCDERLPEGRPPDGEADEPGDAGRRGEPLAYLRVVFAAPQDDATHLGPATAARGGHDPLAVLAPVEP